jgi:hypothetical protein
MKKFLLTAAALAACSMALAKIPPPVLDDAAKAKAAETAAKTAWQAKVDGYLLCKAQDRVAAMYKKTAATKPAAPAAPAASPAAAPATAAVTPASGTPVVASAAPPGPAACADPGPFAYVPPDQKPLEAAGAHSPATTAASPPSTKTPQADMAPSKPGLASSAKKS